MMCSEMESEEKEDSMVNRVQEGAENSLNSATRITAHNNHTTITSDDRHNPYLCSNNRVKEISDNVSKPSQYCIQQITGLSESNQTAAERIRLSRGSKALSAMCKLGRRV